MCKLHNLFATVHQDGGYQNMTSEPRLLQGVYTTLQVTVYLMLTECRGSGFKGLPTSRTHWSAVLSSLAVPLSSVSAHMTTLAHHVTVT